MSKPIGQPSGLLVLPRLRVRNANAISSPLTWGFPSPTAFLGFIHALERHLAQPFGQVFDGVGIVCHGFEPQTFKPNRRQHRIFTQSRNPVYLKTRCAKFIAEGTPAAIVEEGRAHLVVSLIIAVHGGFDEPQEEQDFAEAAYQTALGMRLAGGSVLPTLDPRMPKPQWVPWPEAQVDQRKAFARLRRRLLPGFALVHRPDLLGQRLAKPNPNGDNAAGVLDALLDLIGLNHEPVPVAPAEERIADGAENGTPNPPASPDAPGGDSGSRVAWQVRARPGWLVPLPIGYAGISNLYAPGEVANARDAESPRSASSRASTPSASGIAPHRCPAWRQLLWHGAADPDAGLYRCINRYSDTLPITESESLQGDLIMAKNRTCPPPPSSPSSASSTLPMASFSAGRWDDALPTSANGPSSALREKSVRGTISNRLKTKDQDTAKLDADIENPNLQTVDVATLPNDADTLRVRFTLRVLGGAGAPRACNNADYQAKLRTTVKQLCRSGRFRRTGPALCHTTSPTDAFYGATGSARNR